MNYPSQPQLIGELRRNYLFAGLDEGQLAKVLETAKWHELGADQELFSQGAKADRFFWLRAGAIKLNRLSPAGDEKIIEIVQPGQTFAEALMFLDARLYPVGARALAPSAVLGCESEVLLGILRESVESCFRLMGSMSRRLHLLISEIDSLTLQSGTTRVVEFLLGDAGEGGVVELKTSKHVLAARLSVKPETLSRIFARLSQEGLIRVKGAQIELLDRAGLQRLVAVGEEGR